MKISKHPYDLKTQLKEFPQSAFGHDRKFYIHPGVDIYLPLYTPIISPLEGIVVEQGVFTGDLIGSPWWNYTEYVVVKYNDYFILYGEIDIHQTMDGYRLSIGDKRYNYNYDIGLVMQVLKDNPDRKFINSPTMLHLEMYSKPPFAVTWEIGKPKPENLLDPTDWLLNDC